MNVLVAHDGSNHGRWAMEWVGQLPLASQPTVTVLHVIDKASVRSSFLAQPVVWGVNEEAIEEESDQLDARAKETAEQAKQYLLAMGLKGKVVRAKGAVGTTILEKAPKRDGLVIVGSRGLDRLDRFALGSVSTDVSLQAPCPVLIVKEEPRPTARMVFATDGSKAAEKALQFLMEKMAPHTSLQSGGLPIEVMLIHVVPSLDDPKVEQAGTLLLQQAGDKLIRAGYQVDKFLSMGDAAEEILKLAANKKADLIITGARGLGAIERFLLGSISTNIVHNSPSSVLIVR